MGQGLGHRVAGAQLLRLLHPQQILAGQGGAHLLAAVAVDDDDAVRRQATGGGDDMPEQGYPADGVQNLGEIRLHAGTLTRGKNDYIQSHGRP